IACAQLTKPMETRRCWSSVNAAEDVGRRAIARPGVARTIARSCPIIYGRGRGCTQDKTDSATRTPALPDELSFRAATSRQRDPYWRAGWRLIQSSTPG